jgi:hypothetical protein
MSGYGGTPVFLCKIFKGGVGLFYLLGLKRTQ